MYSWSMTINHWAPDFPFWLFLIEYFCFNGLFALIVNIVENGSAMESGREIIQNETTPKTKWNLNCRNSWMIQTINGIYG